MEENGKFTTRLNTESGESKLDKNSSQKSLTHEEAVKEMEEKTKKILELINTDESKESDIEVLKF